MSLRSSKPNPDAVAGKCVLATALALALGACATVPAPLQGQFSALTPRDAAATGGAEAVRWGGKIIHVDPRADQTCFEILARQLDSTARPVPRDPSDGRFLACHPGFYDPEEFKPDRDLTVVGHLNGTEKGKVGEYEYTYPKVAADAIYLWPKREWYPASPYFYDPWYGPYWGYGPFWGSYWGGSTVIVRQPIGPPPPPPPHGGH